MEPCAISSVVKNENERRQRWAKEIRKKKVQLKANGCTAQYSIIYSIQADDGLYSCGYCRRVSDIRSRNSLKKFYMVFTIKQW